MLAMTLGPLGCSLFIDRELDPDETIPGYSDGVADVTGTTEEEMCGDATPEDKRCPEACDECDDGICVITCSDDCEAEELECPPDRPCRVVCSGEQACKDRDIRCPDAWSCEVVCSGHDGCQGATVICGSDRCSVSCIDEKHPHLECGAACECGQC